MQLTVGALNQHLGNEVCCQRLERLEDGVFACSHGGKKIAQGNDVSQRAQQWAGVQYGKPFLYWQVSFHIIQADLENSSPPKSIGGEASAQDRGALQHLAKGRVVYKVPRDRSVHHCPLLPKANATNSHPQFWLCCFHSEYQSGGSHGNHGGVLKFSIHG